MATTAQADLDDPGRIPDGDRVPMAGYRRWADLLRAEDERPCR